MPANPAVPIGYNDGWLGAPRSIGAPVPDWPFQQLGDLDTLTVTETWKAAVGVYRPMAPLTPHPLWSNAYLVEETKRVRNNLGSEKWQRIYATIPSVKVTYDSTVFNRPLLHDIWLPGGTSNVYAASFEPDTSTLFFSRSGVTALAVPATTYLNPFNSQSLIGHQQVTVTLNTGTVSFYLDDAASTIADAMSTAFSGSTANSANFHISKWTYGVYISWAGVSVQILSLVNTDPTIVTSSRTAQLGAATSTGPLEFVAAQTVAISTRAITTAAAHGAAVGDHVALYNGDRIVAMTKVVSVPSGTAFTIPTDALPGASDVLTHIALQKLGLRLANGSKDCTIRVTAKFYAQTVTTGITTGADIPPVLLYNDPIAWLGRIIARTLFGATGTASNNRLSYAAHGISTGDTFFILGLSGGSGLVALRQYWAYRIDANNWYPCASPDEALVGTSIDITSDAPSVTILL
ncbi:MAG: hypothetical protein JWQ89_3496, partial [Devosia sp.]|uniref:hypothetical protein n=1 Tax=Devosia sp. TaxID=1871048 RepID=UPI002638D191